MDLQEFVRSNAPADGGDGFQKENNRLLDIPLDGTVMVKAGSMVAYTGEVTFTGKSSAEGGITGFVKEAVSGEGTPVMEAEGSGHLYVPRTARRYRCWPSMTENRYRSTALTCSRSNQLSTTKSTLSAVSLAWLLAA